MSALRPGGPECLCASPAPSGHWSLCPVAKLAAERDALAQQLADLRADRDARLAAALKAWQRYRDYRDDPSTRAEAASDLTNILNGRGRCRAPGGGA